MERGLPGAGGEGRGEGMPGGRSLMKMTTFQRRDVLEKGCSGGRGGRTRA